MLNGAQVLVTRPTHQAEELCRLICEQGGVAVRFPTLAIAPLPETEAIAGTLAQLDSYQWLIFISANAVTMHSYYTDSVKMPPFKLAQIAAIGKATAKALALAGLPVAVVPADGYTSEALLAMPQMQVIQGQRCLIIRGEGGREELATILQSRGASVEYLNVYKRIKPEIDNTTVNLLLQQTKLTVITITSGEALENLLAMVTTQQHPQLFTVPLVVISDRISQIAADRGFKRIAVTTSPSDSAILEKIIMCVTGGE